MEHLRMVERAETDNIQLKVRMQEHLRARIEEAARENSTSLNSEIVRRLERSFGTQQAMLAPVLTQEETVKALRILMRTHDRFGTMLYGLVSGEKPLPVSEIRDEMMAALKDLSEVSNQLMAALEQFAKKRALVEVLSGMHSGTKEDQ